MGGVWYSSSPLESSSMHMVLVCVDSKGVGVAAMAVQHCCGDVCGLVFAVGC